MKIRALVSFSGALSMGQGEVRECTDKATLKDLLKAKFIEELKEKPDKEAELNKEIENLKKEIEELKKLPNEIGAEDKELEKDVKSEDEGK